MTKRSRALAVALIAGCGLLTAPTGAATGAPPGPATGASAEGTPTGASAEATTEAPANPAP